MSSFDRSATSNHEIVKAFRYLPPAVEEQRAFALQFMGSVLALVALATFLLRYDYLTPEPGILWGAAVAIVYLAGRSAWKLELKARRAARASIAVCRDGLLMTDSNGRENLVKWSSVTSHDVVGGRLHLGWRGGSLVVGARELEDGISLVREVVARSGQEAAPVQSNFIPLEPR